LFRLRRPRSWGLLGQLYVYSTSGQGILAVSASSRSLQSPFPSHSSTSAGVCELSAACFSRFQGAQILLSAAARLSLAHLHRSSPCCSSHEAEASEALPSDFPVLVWVSRCVLASRAPGPALAGDRFAPRLYAALSAARLTADR